MSPARFAILLVILMAVLAAFPYVFTQRYILHIAVMTALFVTLGLSMNLMLRTGLVSLAHAAFMAIGSYVSALCMMRLGLPFEVAFLAAGVAVMLLALITGPIFLRIKGVYFILLTYALSQVVMLNFQEWVSIFGGNSGLSDIPRPVLFGMIFNTPRQFYWLALGLAGLSFVVVRTIYRSSLGTIIDAIKEEERLSSSLGLNAMGFRVLVFCVSGFLAGLSGSIYAHYMTFLSPDTFNGVMIDVILYNVFGGSSSPIGPVLGALVLVPLPELLRDMQDYQILAYGLLLVVLQLLLPEGLVGLCRRFIPIGRRS